MPSAASGSPGGQESWEGKEVGMVKSSSTAGLVIWKQTLAQQTHDDQHLLLTGDTFSSLRTWCSRQYRWYYYPVQAGKYLPQNRVVRAWNSHFILKAIRPRRWWTCAPKEPVWPWVRIQASFFFFFPGLFYTKRARRKVKHFLFPTCVISSCLQLCTGGPDQALRWVKQRHFSLKLIAWEAGLPEMGHCV